MTSCTFSRVASAMRPEWLMTFDAVLRETPASCATSRSVTRFLSDLSGFTSAISPLTASVIDIRLPTLPPYHEHAVAAHGVPEPGFSSRSVWNRMTGSPSMPCNSTVFCHAGQVEVEGGVGGGAHVVQHVGILCDEAAGYARTSFVRSATSRSQPTKYASPEPYGLRVTAAVPSSSHSSALLAGVREHLRVFAGHVHVVLPRRVVVPFSAARIVGGRQSDLARLAFGFSAEDVEFLAADAQHRAQQAIARARVSAETDVEMLVDQSSRVADHHVAAVRRAKSANRCVSAALRISTVGSTTVCTSSSRRRAGRCRRASPRPDIARYQSRTSCQWIEFHARQGLGEGGPFGFGAKGSPCRSAPVPVPCTPASASVCNDAPSSHTWRNSFVSSPAWGTMAEWNARHRTRMRATGRS